jgi:peptidoglycan/LPS O-acetylase OafA/YrhL
LEWAHIPAGWHYHLQGGFLVPAAILGGIGGILYYQNTTGDWASWAYIWALIPGLVGLGLLVGSFIDRRCGDARKAGFLMLLISLAVTALLGAFFTNNIGFDYAWPIILILAGIVFLFQGIFRRNRKRQENNVRPLKRGADFSSRIAV